MPGTDDKEMPFWDHVEELRWVLVKMILVLAFGTTVGWFFYEPAFDTLVGLVQDDVQVFFPGPLDAFLTKVKLSVLIGFSLTLPAHLWLAWTFISPGLRAHERRLGLWTVAAGTAFFVTGAAFAFYMVRFLLAFLIRFNPDSANIPQLWSLTIYVGFVFRLMVAFGALFELPVVIYLLVSLELIQTATLVKIRPYAVVIAFVAAAMLTPPDVFSQILLGVPLVLLFELGVLVGRVQEKRMARRRARDESPAHPAVP